MLIKESEDKAKEIEETERDNEESAGEGKASNSELIEIDKDIRIVIDSLKEYMSSITDTLRALIQASYY